MSVMIFVIIVLSMAVLARSVFRGRRAASPSTSKRSRPKRKERPSVKPAFHKPSPAPSGTPPSPRPSSVDLSHLVPVSEETSLPEAEEISEEVMRKVVAKAQEVSECLQARRTIFQGVSVATVEPRELTRVVLSDPALAGQILKTVNSAFYGLQHPIGSVFRAVLLLGHGEVRNIVWRISVSESLAPVGGAAELMEELWKHSFASSRIAYAIGKSLGLAEPDEISTAALLHDIGKIVCVAAWPDLAKTLYEPVRFSDHDLLVQEQESLGISHTRLGVEVAKQWGLPDTIRAMVGYHHAPSYVETEALQENHRAIAVVHVADLLCHSVRSEESREHEGQIYLPRESWTRILTGGPALERVCTDSVIRALGLPGIGVGQVLSRGAAALGRSDAVAHSH